VFVGDGGVTVIEIVGLDAGKDRGFIEVIRNYYFVCYLNLYIGRTVFLNSLLCYIFNFTLYAVLPGHPYAFP